MHVDGDDVDVQYSNWTSSVRLINKSCVVVTKDNEWRTWNCSEKQLYVCQS